MQHSGLFKEAKLNRADLMVRSNLAGVTPSSITPTLMALRRRSCG